MKLRFPLFAALMLPWLGFATDVPENLGLGLKQLVENYQSDQPKFRATMSTAKTVKADTATNRVIVNVHLNGAKSADDVKSDLEALGLEILQVDSNWRRGVISAWLPISQAT